jgi:hypothetical protein
MDAIFGSLMQSVQDGYNPMQAYYEQFQNRVFNTMDTMEAWFPQHIAFIREQKNQFAGAIGAGAVEHVVKEFYNACKPYQLDIAKSNEAVFNEIVKFPIIAELDKKLDLSTAVKTMSADQKRFIWSSLASLLVISKRIIENRVPVSQNQMMSFFQHSDMKKVFETVSSVAQEFENSNGRKPNMEMSDIMKLSQVVKERLAGQPIFQDLTSQEDQKSSSLASTLNSVD